ncbi:MAG: winged helix DNA-binding domain-containing protein [Flavobacteriales bacterium]
MKTAEIIARRLTNQGLIGKAFTDPVMVVRHFAAMQAQDYYGAKWAIGQRTGADDAAVEDLFNAGKILRTHLCRPTWHFVLPQDIRWLLQLTGPRVQQLNAFMYRQLGLDKKRLAKATDIMAKLLQGGKHLDREPLMAALRKSRFDVSENRPSHYLMFAELEGVICSGPRVGKQFTYALLEERAPQAEALDRDEALAELTHRYFASRGPATLNDFALWSGLTIAAARKGIAMVERDFTKVAINDRDNWYPKDSTPLKAKTNTVHLLPNYDEYGIGYKDRSAFYDPSQAQLSGSRGNPVFRHLIVVNGKMMGTWDRALSARSVRVSSSAFTPLSTAANAALAQATKRYAAFLGTTLAT